MDIYVVTDNYRPGKPTWLKYSPNLKIVNELSKVGNITSNLLSTLPYCAEVNSTFTSSTFTRNRKNVHSKLVRSACVLWTLHTARRTAKNGPCRRLGRRPWVTQLVQSKVSPVAAVYCRQNVYTSKMCWLARDFVLRSAPLAACLILIMITIEQSASCWSCSWHAACIAIGVCAVCHYCWARL